MSCFMKEDIQDDRFPQLSSEVHRLKHTEGGLSAVSKIMDEIKQEVKAEGRAEGLAEGRAEGRAEGLAEGHANGRLESIAIFLQNGGTESEAKRRLQATPLEIERAKKL